MADPKPVEKEAAEPVKVPATVEKARPAPAKVESGEKDDNGEIATFAPKGLKASGTMVQHRPMEFFSVRLIRKEHWESIGIFDQGGVEWNASNNFMLPVEMFTEKALDYLRNRDDGFKIIEP